MCVVYALSDVVMLLAIWGFGVSFNFSQSVKINDRLFLVINRWYTRHYLFYVLLDDNGDDS